MVQVDSSSFKQSLHFRKIARSAVDSILARIILERGARDDEVRVRDYCVRIWTRLSREGVGR